MDILQLVVLVRKLDAERAGEAVAEVVAGAGLQGLAVMHEGLDRVGRLGAGEFLLVRLAAADDRDCQEVLQEIRIDVQHELRALLGLLRRCMGGVAFLPQELAGAKERTRGLLPSHNRAPLVVDLRQVAVGVDILRVEIAEERLGSRTHAHALLQFI